jgi:hypothetical protein
MKELTLEMGVFKEGQWVQMSEETMKVIAGGRD